MGRVRQSAVLLKSQVSVAGLRHAHSVGTERRIPGERPWNWATVFPAETTVAPGKPLAEAALAVDAPRSAPQSARPTLRARSGSPPRAPEAETRAEVEGGPCPSGLQSTHACVIARQSIALTRLPHCSNAALI